MWGCGVVKDGQPETGEIDGYSWAVLPHGLIAVKRPDGSLTMLPAAADIEVAVRAFVEKDAHKAEE